MDDKILDQVDQLLAPYFKTLGDKVSAIKTEVKVDVPEPKVTVNVPDIKIPKIELPAINVPEVKIPPIVVPEPKITVNVDKVRVENWPEFPAPQVFDDTEILAALKKLLNKTSGGSGNTSTMWYDSVDGKYVDVSAAKPLPVDIQDASIAVTGPLSVIGVDDMGATISATNFPVLIAGRTDITNTTSEGAVVSPGVLGIDADARPVTASGYLTTRSVFYGLNGTTMDRIRAGVADGTSRTGHLTVQPMMTDGTNYAQLRGTSTDGLTVNLGTNNDVTVTNATAANLNMTEASASAIKTAVELIDDAIKTDDASFTPGTTKVMMAGFEADESSTDSVDEGDAGAARMTLDRKLIVTTLPHTAGGLLIKNCTAGDGSTALTNSAQAIKASAGQLFGWYIFNPNTVTVWLNFYNTAATSVTVGTTNPVMVFGVPAGSAANVVNPMGIEFTNAGWSVAAVMTTAGGNTAPTTAVDANFFYI